MFLFVFLLIDKFILLHRKISRVDELLVVVVVILCVFCFHILHGFISCQQLDESYTCVMFRAERWYPIANATIQHRMRVYDYYEPGNAAYVPIPHDM